MAENRSHSKVENLPDDLKKDVEERLVGGDTYKDISDRLKDKGHDISSSSVGRYGRKYLKKFESVRIAKQFAKLLAEDDIERPATELSEANNLLMNQIIMETLMDEDKDSKDVTGAAKAIASLQSAQVANERLKILARKEVGAVHTAMNILKNKVFIEISQSYPEVAQVLIELAEQTEKEMEKIR
jgi:hypothetical protein|nr:MAG TPA: Protein of unknown function (DUF3486) [Caudoviricetes sp.]